MTINNRRQEIQALKERLARVAALPPNKVCSECPESSPTWASILRLPPPAAGTATTNTSSNRLGVLCCYKCSILHFQLGKDVCTVKNIKMAEEWTQEEIQILETSGGNQIVNALYEAGLNKATYNKWIVLDDEEEEDTNRKEFIQNKYQHLEYFDPVLYQAHCLHRNKRRQAATNHNRPASRTARRCRSFDHENNTKLEKVRKELIRKPMRRRSQSYEDNLSKIGDDGGESTDGESTVTYNLPGHLKRMSVSADQHTSTNGSRRRGNNNKRRSSMPKLFNNTSTTTSGRGERRQRRASRTSTTASLRSDDSNTTVPLRSELGYGDDNDDSSIDNSMDATDRRSNRRRDSSSANSPGRQGGGGGQHTTKDLMTNSTSRWRSGRRRTSLPSSGLGAAPPSPSPFDYDSCGTHQSFSSSSNRGGAPKMPTRCISSDSGEDDLGNETDDTGFMSPAPSTMAKINDRIPRRVRRMSLPAGMSSGDEDDLNKAITDHHAYSPSIPRLTRFDDHRSMNNKSKSLYGMDLGYGFDPTIGGGGSGGDSDCSGNTNSQKKQVKKEVKPAPIKPTRMPQQTFNGGPAFKRCGTAPSRPPPKLLLDSDSALSSADELSYGFPSPCPNKKTQTRRKRTARANRRTMRRCSTGGALDAKLNRKVPSRQSSFSTAEDSINSDKSSSVNAAAPSHHHETLPTLPGSSTKKGAQTQTTLKNLKNLAKGNNLSHFVKEADLGYEDVSVPSPRQQHRDDDLPSLADLGYGGHEGGHESMASIMSMDTTGSATGYGADMSCANLGRYFDIREHEERTRSCVSRMQRRSSTGATGRRGSSTGISRRRCSTNGAYTTPPRSRRRASNRAGGDDGYHHVRPGRRRSSVGGAAPVRSGSMLSTGPGTLMRADSLSSLGSEISANAALLYAGDKKYYSSSKSDTKSNGMKDDSNLSSASPVSVSLIGYNSVFGKALDDPLSASSEKDPADSADHDIDDNKASGCRNQSRKDYWKSKLHEQPDPTSGSKAQDDGDTILSYQPRRSRRRKSLTTACA